MYHSRSTDMMIFMVINLRLVGFSYKENDKSIGRTSKSGSSPYAKRDDQLNVLQLVLFLKFVKLTDRPTALRQLSIFSVFCLQWFKWRQCFHQVLMWWEVEANNYDSYISHVQWCSKTIIHIHGDNWSMIW